MFLWKEIYQLDYSIGIQFFFIFNIDLKKSAIVFKGDFGWFGMFEMITM